MEYRTLGRTGLRVSVAGLGTGGASKLGQSAGLSASESHRIVRTALNLGINVFDTSPGYGASEELLGGALAGVPRDRYVLATKFQPGWDRLGEDPQALTRSLENSLRRLRVEAVDVLQYHGVKPHEYRTVVERFHPVVLRAQQAGKVRFLGITATAAGDPENEMLPMALEDDLFDCIMVKFGILNQSARRKVFPMALQRNVGVFVMASVRQSLRKPSEAVARINGFIDEGLLAIPRPSLDDPLGLARPGEPVPSLTRAAYQFAAESEAVSTVLIGTGGVDHLKTNVADILGPRSQRRSPPTSSGHTATCAGTPESERRSPRPW